MPSLYVHKSGPDHAAVGTLLERHSFPRRDLWHRLDMNPPTQSPEAPTAPGDSAVAIQDMIKKDAVDEPVSRSSTASTLVSLLTNVPLGGADESLGHKIGHSPDSKAMRSIQGSSRDAILQQTGEFPHLESSKQSPSAAEQSHMADPSERKAAAPFKKSFVQNIDTKAAAASPSKSSKTAKAAPPSSKAKAVKKGTGNAKTGKSTSPTTSQTKKMKAGGAVKVKPSGFDESEVGAQISLPFVLLFVLLSSRRCCLLI
jgi:hypothetical protein